MEELVPAVERVDAEWRLMKRVIHGDLLGDLSGHIAGDPAAAR